VSASISTDLSFYSKHDEEFEITSFYRKKFEFWIGRAFDTTNFNYESMNVTNLSSSVFQNTYNQLLTTGFKPAAKNFSIHVHFRPNNSSIGYLIALKMGSNPIINSSFQSFDYFEILCSRAVLTDSQSNKYHLIFLNMNQTSPLGAQSNKYVGMGIRELTADENFNLCLSNSTNKTSQPPIQPAAFGLNFTDDISIRAFTSGCYYLNKTTGEWLSDGVEVQMDTNTTHTHCISSHLTEFAGGFVVVPNQINFDYVWANADFLKNPTIYATVIAITCLYLLAIFWCRWMDLVDLKKTQVYLLDDNNVTDTYLYEILVFTGNRQDAGTESQVGHSKKNKILNKKLIFFDFKVYMTLSGTLGETVERHLKSELKSYAFKRGGIDTFIMSVKK
jgi:hypothetical protein